MSRADTQGYIAISRSIFDHPEFRERRPLTRFEAWEWLIAHAAWKDTSVRLRNDTVRLKRGQISLSLRDLGVVWRWPKSNVGRWLHRLAAKDMLRLQKSGTAPGTVSGTARLVISICNYDKFNKTRKKVGHEAGQHPGQEPAQALLFAEKYSAEPTNQLTIESGAAGDRSSSVDKSNKLPGQISRQHAKPRHGARGNGMIWCDHETQDWAAYSRDFQDVKGASIIPETRVGGRGNWFRINGETRGRKAR